MKIDKSGFVPVGGSFKGYWISREGTVASQWSMGRNSKISDDVWREIRPGTKKTSGYKFVLLSRVGKKPSYQYVHRLVLEAFRGPCPSKMEACHYDDDHKNNNLSNLRWGSRQSNRDDARRNGKLAMGSRTGTSKLVEADIFKIRKLLKTGIKQKRIAAMFGVCVQTISSVCTRATWGHIKSRAPGRSGSAGLLWCADLATWKRTA